MGRYLAESVHANRLDERHHLRLPAEACRRVVAVIEKAPASRPQLPKF